MTTKDKTYREVSNLKRDIKTCRDCKQDLPYDSFPKNRSISDGIHYYCRACVKKRNADHYLKNSEYMREKSRRFFKSAKGKATLIKSSKKMSELYPEKHKARYQLRYAVKRGKVTKPTACSECLDADKRIEAHHHLGYEEKHWFDVQWLCWVCHKKVHGTLREELL